MIDEILARLSKRMQIEVVENALQKDLTESEKAKVQKLLKAELASNTQQGKRNDLTSSKNLEKVKHGILDDVGEIFGESHETVRKRLDVFEKIEKNPKKFANLKDRIDSGKTSISYAYGMINRDEQKNTPTPELPKDKYDIVYADFPWDYDLPLSGAPPYKTMKLDEIKQEISELPLGKNGIIFMWATNPKLQEAFNLLEFYGLEYKTNMVWVKQKNGKTQEGTGYYVKGSHELLLIATKGSPGVPPEDKRFPSVVYAERTRKHSEKPAIFRKIINEMYPAKKKIELFNRKIDEYHNSTWIYWGDQAE